MGTFHSFTHFANSDRAIIIFSTVPLTIRWQRSCYKNSTTGRHILECPLTLYATVSLTHRSCCQSLWIIEIMINTHKTQYKNLFHPLCMYHNNIHPVISSGISTVGGAVCRHQMLHGKGKVLHLINLYETDLKANCIFWQPECFWFSEDIYIDIKQTHSIQHARPFTSMFWRPAYGFIGQKR